MWENLHCLIRAKHGADDHPAPQAYVNALRILSCKTLTAELLALEHPSGANCEPEPWDCSGTALNDSPQPQSSAQHEADDAVEEDAEEQSVCADFKAVEGIEAETAVYIVGAAVRKLMMGKDRCQECISLCVDGSAPVMTFSKFKEFNEGALLNTSLPLRDIAVCFEGFFKSVVEQACAAPHPRQFIISAFLSSVILDYSHFTCLEHTHNIVRDILAIFCNIRLFHVVKMLNVKLSTERKKNELTKDKKLGL